MNSNIQNIYLVRHGQSRGNVDQAVYGNTADHAIALSELGERQPCGAAGRSLPYASTMKSLLILALCFATCVQAADLRGRVVAVSDGDTVTVLDAERHQHKVRLAGIDAPEKA